MPTALDRKQVAEKTKLSVSTLAKKAMSGDGPPMRKIGRRVVYIEEEVDAWLDQHFRRSTSEPANPKRA